MPTAAVDTAALSGEDPARALTDSGFATRGHRFGDVYRRLARRDAVRLRDPKRIVAIVLLALTGGLMAAFLFVRGPLGGADALAYWAGVHVWLAGGDPYHPEGVFLPYVYAPWLLPLFVPWALLPWNVAWFAWRGLNVLLFLWSAEWAYRRHPLGTAIIVVLLAIPLIVTFDTGNVTLLLALAIWAAQFSSPRVGGALWALAASMKWFPAALIVVLPPRARLWGVLGAVVALALALATWPETIVQLETVLNFPRPPRVDYFLLLWAAVPWLWRHPHPLWWVNRRELPGVVSHLRARGRVAWRGFRRSPEATATQARREVGARVRAFFGV